MRNAKPYRGAALVLCLASTAACERAPVEPEVQDGSAFVLALTGASLAIAMEPGQSVVRECEAGGRIVAEGTESVETRDAVLVHTWDRRLRHEHCGINVQGDLAIANGEMQLTGEAHFGLPVNGRAPLLQQQSRQVGTMTTTWRGETRTCVYDLTANYDAASRVYRLTGVACGHAVQRQVRAFR